MSTQYIYLSIIATTDDFVNKNRSKGKLQRVEIIAVDAVIDRCTDICIDKTSGSSTYFTPQIFLHSLTTTIFSLYFNLFVTFVPIRCNPHARAMLPTTQSIDLGRHTVQLTLNQYTVLQHIHTKHKFAF